MSTHRPRAFRSTILRRALISLALIAPPVSIATAQSRVDTVYVQRSSVGQSKDEGTALLWSFFFTGAGQMYAGEPGKGVALFVASEAGFVAMVGGILATPGTHDCTSTVTSKDPFGNQFTTTRVTTCANSRVSENAVALAGGALWLGSWIYSMVDAGAAVRRFNERHGVHVTLVPTKGSVTAGVAFAVR